MLGLRYKAVVIDRLKLFHHGGLLVASKFMPGRYVCLRCNQWWRHRALDPQTSYNQEVRNFTVKWQRWQVLMCPSCLLDKMAWGSHFPRVMDYHQRSVRQHRALLRRRGYRSVLKGGDLHKPC